MKNIKSTILKPIKRVFGFCLFMSVAIILVFTAFPFLFVFYGIDTANDFMENVLDPIVDLWD